MLIGAVKLATIALFAVVCGSVPATALDEYDIRCNRGSGKLPKDGVICLSFRAGTTAKDFAEIIRSDESAHMFIAQDGRALAADCPHKAYNDAGEEFEILRRAHPNSAPEPYLFLKGQMQSGGHQCCAAEWANGDGRVYKWCPDMPPLQV